MLIVRDAQPPDAIGVGQVHVRAWQVAYRGLLPDAYLDGLRAEDRAERYAFARSPAEEPWTIVAIQADAVVGFATVGTSRPDGDPSTGELHALYVDPECWSRGLGRRLMHEARTRLSERGFAEAVLWMLVGNGRAKRFYEADGWRPDAVRRHSEVWGVVVYEERYRRRL